MSERLDVSDHAILRYLQRAHGLDIEALRATLASALQRGADIGAPHVLYHGVRFVIRNGVVVTAMERKMNRGIRRRSFGDRDD